MKTRFLIIFLTLTLLLTLPACGGSPSLTEPSLSSPLAASPEEVCSTPAGTPASISEAGELLDSGSDINKNFFAGLDYSGAASGLEDSSFQMGKAGMAFDSMAHNVLSPFKVHYGKDTTVKKAVLYYASDTYEIYASSLEEFREMMREAEYGIDVAVFLVNSEAEELWAKEIRIYEMR